jgi:tRNA 2-thiouridine synthesizing protein A
MAPDEVARDQLPKPVEILDASGNACAELTPLLKERLAPLPSGAVLEVHSDDPAARAGMPAWSRLTGHALLATIEEPEGRTRFLVRRK